MAWHDMRWKDVFRILRGAGSNIGVPEISRQVTFQTAGHMTFSHNPLYPPTNDDPKVVDDFIWLLATKWSLDGLYESFSLNAADWIYIRALVPIAKPEILRKYPGFEMWLADQYGLSVQGLLDLTKDFILNPVAALIKFLKNIGLSLLEQVLSNLGFTREE